jgi:hypothetical protein
MFPDSCLILRSSELRAEQNHCSPVLSARQQGNRDIQPRIDQEFQDITDAKRRSKKIVNKIE